MVHQLTLVGLKKLMVVAENYYTRLELRCPTGIQSIIEAEVFNLQEEENGLYLLQGIPRTVVHAFFRVITCRLTIRTLTSVFIETHLKTNYSSPVTHFP